MEKTVVGLMDSRAEAERVVRDLLQGCDCDRADIGLMARGAEGDEPVTQGEHGGAARGAMAGAGVGGVLGLVAGLTSLAIPGLGPFIAAGPIASALAGAGIGAVAGGVIGALRNIGVPESEAHYYAEGVKRGGTLITVHARSEEAADCAANVMRTHGAADIEERAAAWRQEGWQGRFDHDAGDLRADRGLGATSVPPGTHRPTDMQSDPLARDEAGLRGRGLAAAEFSSANYAGPERRMGAGRNLGGVERRRGAG